MPPDEGLALYDAGVEAARLGGPLVEVGTYCGKSSVYLGAAARDGGSVLFTIDHHRGSEENQAGWEHHDPTIVDAAIGRIDTLPFFRRTIYDAGLEDVVIAIVGDSPTVAAHRPTPRGLVSTEGGRGGEPAHGDCGGWWPKVRDGGLLAIHDVFETPAEGGPPPYEIFCRAVDSGHFVE